MTLFFRVSLCIYACISIAFSGNVVVKNDLFINYDMDQKNYTSVFRTNDLQNQHFGYMAPVVYKNNVFIIGAEKGFNSEIKFNIIKGTFNNEGTIDWFTSSSSFPNDIGATIIGYPVTWTADQDVEKIWILVKLSDGRGALFKSDNGTDWIQHAFAPLDGDPQLERTNLVVHKGMLYLFSPVNCMHTNDGQSWMNNQEAVYNTSSKLEAFSVNNRLWVVDGSISNNSAWYSDDDGVNWNITHDIYPFITMGGSIICDIGNGDEIIVDVTAGRTTSTIFSTTDFYTFDQRIPVSGENWFSYIRPSITCNLGSHRIFSYSKKLYYLTEDKCLQIYKKLSVTGKINSSGIPVTVNLVGQGISLSTTTSTNGSYSFTVPPGTYTITPVSSTLPFCPAEQTVTANSPTTIVPDMSLSRINFFFGPHSDSGGIRVGQEISFTPIGADQCITSYNWDFGDGSKITSDNPVHVFKTGTASGSIPVKLTACFRDNKKLSITKNIILDCGPPGNPKADFIFDPSGTTVFLREDIDDSGNVIWEIEDQCVLGSEIVTLRDISTPYSCGLPATIISREWKLDNASKGTGTSTTLTLSTSSQNIVSLKVTDINGNTNTVTRRIVLVPCAPGIKNIDFDILYNNSAIQGEIFFDVINRRGLPGNGIKTFTLDTNVSLRCECLITEQKYSWKIKYLNTNYEYADIDEAGPVNFTTDRGFGTYEFTLEVKINGTIIATKTKKLMITFPLPFIACAPYGCSSVSNSCFSLHDTIDISPIDKSMNLSDGSAQLSLRACGFGFANKPASLPDGTREYLSFWDEGAMKSTVANGDFSISARLVNQQSLLPGVQSGIMVRTGNASFDKMLFIGCKNSVPILLHRKRVRQDAYKFTYTSRSDTWFKISRTGNKINVFGSSDGINWDTLNPDAHELSSLEGSLLIGLAAAGNPGLPYQKASFDNIIINIPETDLNYPNEIINTVFADGNLVKNWSFENNQHSFSVIGTGSFDNHFENSNNSAYEGHYTARLSNKTALWTIESDKFSTSYTRNAKTATQFLLEFYLKPNVTIQNAPTVSWYSDNGNLLSTTVLDSKTVTAGIWNHLQYRISIPSDSGITFFNVKPVSLDVSADTIDMDNILITPVYNSESNKPITIISFADGFNQKFQTVQNAGDSDIVSATLLDDNSRIERSIPLFVSHSGLHSVKKDPVAEMESYYKPLNVGWDISKLQKNFGTIHYENSPLSRLSQTLGLQNYMDVINLYTNDSVSGFAPHQLIQETRSGFDYYQKKYQISREFTDAFGHIIKKETSYKDGSSDPKNLVSTYETDILDRTWKKVSPMGQNCEQSDSLCKSASTCIYSTINEILETNTADAGKSMSLYDKLGKIRLFKDANKITAKQILVNIYDAFSRVTAVYLVNDTNGIYWNQTNADDPQWPINIQGHEQWSHLLIKNVYDFPPLSLPDGITTDSFSNTQSRVTAQTAFTSNGLISDYFSYDKKGNPVRNWKKIFNLPLYTIAFEYNLNNEIISKTESGTEPRTSRDFHNKLIYSYDHLNRLKKILRLKESNFEPIAMYDFYPDGKIRYEYFGNSLNLRNAYVYDFANRLSRKNIEKYLNNIWTTTTTYRQLLTYDLRGNLRKQQSHVNGVIEPNHIFQYNYDQFNRLQSAHDESNNYTPAHSVRPFALEVEYDDDGSITRMAQGPHVSDFPVTSGQYYYYPNSHRLEKITGLIFSNGKDRSCNENFQYDPNGNLISDKANLRKINYDFRNLPSSVTEYSDSTMSVVKNQTQYFYDAKGNRVLKTQLK